MPLVFGTLKGTFYALLFAIPLAVLGALYVSQFVHPDIRGRIKPTVEIMAALPSVVIGFVAGLYLAPLVERQVVPILLMVVLMPAAGTAGVLLWGRLPKAWRRGHREGRANDPDPGGRRAAAAAAATRRAGGSASSASIRCNTSTTRM